MKLKTLFYILISFIFTIMSYAFGKETSAQPNLLKRMVPSAEQQSPWFSTNIPSALGWVSDDNPNNLCNGTFSEPQSVSSVPRPPNFKQTKTFLTSQGPAHINLHGLSTLQDRVVVTQKGRIVNADKAYIYRDKEGKLKYAHLVGHVSIEEHNYHTLATEAWLNVKKNIYHAYDLLYRAYVLIASNNQSMQPIYRNAWGQASSGMRDPKRIMHYKEATYTTCSPKGSQCWWLHAKNLKLDMHNGEGRAYNAYVTIHHIPILYSPYLWFPLDNRRKSGFLYPKFGQDSNDGFFISTPWYWNMAPNYDMLITPRLMTKRGLLLDDSFRYLTPKNNGQISLSFNPHDMKFNKFKNDTLSKRSTYPSSYKPYLDRLAGQSAMRYYFSMHNRTQWNKWWSIDLTINHVNDDYYFQNYSEDYAGTTNQLLNQLKTDYAGLHWQFTGLFEGYQTLHPFNDMTNNQDQYRRLPELDLSGDYPNQFWGTDLGLSSQLVNFDYQSNIDSQLPTGQRLHIQPSMSKSFTWAPGYITPQVLLDNVDYHSIHHFVANKSVSKTRTLPIFDIDSGLYFDRNFHVGKSHYIQTLEPRIFYLYVPYKKQNDLPNFDTQLLSFSFDQLFATNRYSGFDRLDNANQMSFGLTTRVLNASDSSEKLDLGLGTIYYFQPSKVQLNTTTPLNTNHWSPIVTKMTYYPWAKWSSTLSAAWDTKKKRLDNGSINLTYNPSSDHLFNVGYQYVQADGIDPQGYSNSTSQVYVGGTWPLAPHWSGLGYLFYNLSKHNLKDTFIGVQYDACCWGLRIVARREYIGDEPEGTTFNRQFKTGAYIQLLLKGLGAFGNSSISDDLAKDLPGYFDEFKQG